jgi:hypothetical protein
MTYQGCRRSPPCIEAVSTFRINIHVSWFASALGAVPPQGGTSAGRFERALGDEADGLRKAWLALR